MLATVLLLSTSLAACGSAGNTGSTTKDGDTPAGQNDKIKLKIYAAYFDDDTKKPYDYAVEELKKEMPNVELDLEPSMQDDGQKLRTYAPLATCRISSRQTIERSRHLPNPKTLRCSTMLHQLLLSRMI